MSKTLRDLHNDERGIFSYVVILIFVFIGMFTIFVFVAPILQLFTVASYQAMEPVLDATEAKVNAMSDTNLKASGLAMINAQKDNVDLNNEIFGSMFQYSAILVIIIVLIVMFLVLRSNAEIQTPIQ